MYLKTLSILFAVLIAVFVLNGGAVEACLWTYGTDVHGHRIETTESGGAGYIIHLTEMKSHYVDLIKRLPSLATAAKTGDHEAQTNYAVALIVKGETDRGIELLKDIESQRPGLYETAANLGTAYELKGDDQQALHWIEEGMRRNKQSHEGTEWIHVKILQTKLKLKEQPDWLERHSVLNLDFGDNRFLSEPILAGTGLPNNINGLKEVHDALEYQLMERLALVDPPDAIVGDLLFDLGNLNALVSSLESAIPAYELAMKYGTTRGGLARARVDYLSDLIHRGALREMDSSPVPYVYWPFISLMVILAAAVLILLVLLVILFLRVRKMRARTVD